MYETHSRRDQPPSRSPSDFPAAPPPESPPYWQAGRRPLPPLGPLDPLWDPAEELACLLQESVPPEHLDAFASAVPVRETAHDACEADQSLAGLEQITAQLSPVRPPTPSHRRVSPRKGALTPLQTGSFFTAALAAVIVSMVSVYGGMVTYDPLRHVAEPRTPRHVVGWWPLLVYGPWMVASLSILRAALHRRRAAHSWCVVLLFSTIAVILCVAQAPRTITDAAAAALPAVAALACFQQLVRQITLTRPPRQAAPRHRNVTPSPPPPRRDESTPPIQ